MKMITISISNKLTRSVTANGTAKYSVLCVKVSFDIFLEFSVMYVRVSRNLVHTYSQTDEWVKVGSFVSVSYNCEAIC